MPTRTPAATITGNRVYLRPPRPQDATAFIAAVRASRKLHGPWTQAPASAERFAALVRRYGSRQPAPSHAGFLVVRLDTHALAGVLNFSEIVRGPFQSTYLGYYGFHPHAGQGFMTEGMVLALDVAFRRLELHRVEVNVQPTNLRSVALAERVGFTREGFSRRYVKIAGRWRDHVRYAMLAEDWRVVRRNVLARRPPP
jgi:[ribosomal protein S5]-alanine N-acetyltransferase